jgi:hypothetical protein
MARTRYPHVADIAAQATTTDGVTVVGDPVLGRNAVEAHAGVAPAATRQL